MRLSRLSCVSWKRLKKANEAASYKAEPIKKDIPFEDFEKLDIRVGHIIKCEKVKKSKEALAVLDRRWFGY